MPALLVLPPPLIQSGPSNPSRTTELTLDKCLPMEMSPPPLPMPDHHTNLPFKSKRRTSQPGSSLPFSDTEMTRKFKMPMENTPPRLPMVDHHTSQLSRLIPSPSPPTLSPMMSPTLKSPPIRSSRRTQHTTPGSPSRMAPPMANTRESSLQISHLTLTIFS